VDGEPLSLGQAGNQRKANMSNSPNNTGVPNIKNRLRKPAKIDGSQRDKNNRNMIGNKIVTEK
jgi:hypothetical protein